MSPEPTEQVGHAGLPASFLRYETHGSRESVRRRQSSPFPSRRTAGRRSVRPPVSASFGDCRGLGFFVQGQIRLRWAGVVCSRTSRKKTPPGVRRRRPSTTVQPPWRFDGHGFLEHLQRALGTQRSGRRGGMCRSGTGSVSPSVVAIFCGRGIEWLGWLPLRSRDGHRALPRPARATGSAAGRDVRPGAAERAGSGKLHPIIVAPGDLHRVRRGVDQARTRSVATEGCGARRR